MPPPKHILVPWRSNLSFLPCSAWLMHQHLQRGFFVVRRFRQSHNKKQPGPLLHHVPPLWHAVLLRWAGGGTVNLRSLRDASLATLHQRQHHQWSKKRLSLTKNWRTSGLDPLTLVLILSTCLSLKVSSIKRMPASKPSITTTASLKSSMAVLRWWGSWQSSARVRTEMPCSTRLVW